MEAPNQSTDRGPDRSQHRGERAERRRHRAPARSPAETAQTAAAPARGLDATGVTLVTPRWPASRAGMLVRAALPGVAAGTPSPGGRPPVTLLARELCCLVALPYHLTRLRS